VPEPEQLRRRLRPLIWTGGGLVLGIVVTVCTAYATRSWWTRTSWSGSHVSYADVVEIYAGKGYGKPVLTLADGVTGRAFHSMLVADPPLSLAVRGETDVHSL